MKNIYELAKKINEEREESFIIDNDLRLKKIMNRFEEDFGDVVNELKSVGVKMHSFFVYRDKDEYIKYPNTERLHSTHLGDSIIFLFDGEDRHKRIFYNNTEHSWQRKGWYYVATSGSLVNADIFFEDLRRDLIIFLSLKDIKGEYK